MSIVEITDLTHSFGDNILFKNADFVLNKGEHAGVVGNNGAGKSTFIKICTGQAVPDSGRVSWIKGITSGYLDQYAHIDAGLTLEGFLKSAFMNLYRMEEQMNELYRRAAEGDMDSMRRAARYQERLEASGFYSIDTYISQVAAGLGLTGIGMERPVGQMSGGQRAKVILAKLLLEKPDVLLLDEPTNFLDKEHVAWLGGYL